MNVMIIGGGGREHAMAWKVAQSAEVKTVFVVPGNAGTARESSIQNVELDPVDFAGLANFASENNVSLTIVGPEQPLVGGVVDYFEQRNLRCFGPTRGAAQLEGSKTFTKEFLSRHNIPTAAFASFTDAAEAMTYVREQGVPIVIKADGLAAGKGVVIAESLEHAESTLLDMLSGNAFGEAGNRVVVEEFLAGEEASFIVMVDGEHILPLANSQDHKRVHEGDRGANTGGMGAYSPAPVVSEAVHQKIMQQVIEPTVRGMAAEGNPYTGFLYAGLMIAEDDEPRVIEFNCRLGDPETQPILMRLKSDLVALCNAALDNALDSVTAEWDPRSAIGVVLISGGYPGKYSRGEVITGLESTFSPDIKVFHAGTCLNNEHQVVTDGGRVLCVTALGEDIAAAQQSCYEAASRISWEGMTLRRDIGWRAVKRPSHPA